MLKGNKTIYAMLLVSFAVFAGMFTIAGCGSDSTTSTTTADPNVVKIDSSYAIPTGKNSINLVTGANLSSSDATKDISIIPSGIATYIMQSGSLIAPGENTMFVLVDSNDTKATFDAISTVASWGTTINPSTFTLSATGNLSVGQVYGFYLKGKFDDHTLSVQTYGILRINSVTSGGINQSVSINIKYNKTGANKFN